jgi:hypothetical protein
MNPRGAAKRYAWLEIRRDFKSSSSTARCHALLATLSFALIVGGGSPAVSGDCIPYACNAGCSRIMLSVSVSTHKHCLDRCMAIFKACWARHSGDSQRISTRSSTPQRNVPLAHRIETATRPGSPPRSREERARSKEVSEREPSRRSTHASPRPSDSVRGHGSMQPADLGDAVQEQPTPPLTSNSNPQNPCLNGPTSAGCVLGATPPPQVVLITQPRAVPPPARPPVPPWLINMLSDLVEPQAEAQNSLDDYMWQQQHPEDQSTPSPEPTATPAASVPSQDEMTREYPADPYYHFQPIPPPPPPEPTGLEKLERGVSHMIDAGSENAKGNWQSIKNWVSSWFD